MLTCPSFIPVLLPGGIGDVIMSVDFIRELKKKYQIIVHSGHAEALTYFIPDLHVENGTPNYSWHLSVDHIAKFKFTKFFSGFLLPEHKDLYSRQANYFKQDKTNREYAEYAETLGFNKRELCFHSLNLKYVQEHKKQKPQKKFITIHDGYDISNLNQIKDRSTKQWSINNWNELVRGLTKLDYEIIQLGSISARDIKGAKSLVGKTSITEAFDIISEASIHIDGDSGLVHAASRMQVPCVVIWGPTSHEYYGYEENINLSNSPCEKNCFSITPTWMSECAKGYGYPKCMDQVRPEQVLASVKLLLS